MAGWRPTSRPDQAPPRGDSGWNPSARPASRRPTFQPAAWRFEAEGGRSLKLSDGGRPVLTYNYGTITKASVPASDGRRRRACYVHPLWGLQGECLTADFPKDHYHHHGVFWTWPHVTIDGHDYDLWENRGIRPEFVGWLGRQSGPAAAVLGVENGWFVGGRKVMIERVWLRVSRAARDERALDLDFTWIPVDRPITLRGAEGKSYGGLTVRFAVRSEKDSTITVPGGSGSADLPDTPLAWADLTARFAGAAAPSGAAIFVPLDHPDYPPTWLTRHYGPLCIGWPGVKGRTFPPGKPIHLSYRIWIHRTAVSPEQLKLAYQAYTTEVRWQKRSAVLVRRVVEELDCPVMREAVEADYEVAAAVARGGRAAQETQSSNGRVVVDQGIVGEAQSTGAIEVHAATQAVAAQARGVQAGVAPFAALGRV